MGVEVKMLGVHAIDATIGNEIADDLCTALEVNSPQRARRGARRRGVLRDLPLWRGVLRELPLWRAVFIL